MEGKKYKNLAHKIIFTAQVDPAVFMNHFSARVF